MSRNINYIGNRFGRLTVLERAEDHITKSGAKKRSIYVFAIAETRLLLKRIV